MKKFATVIVVGAVVLCLSAQSAFAVKPFLDAFKAKYPNVTGAATAGCNVCHEGTDKKNRNAYGMALNKYVKKTDAKDAAKIEAAFEGAVKDNAKFGENLKAGKLPTE